MYREIPADKLIPWPGLNPRRVFAETALQELAVSIDTHGLLEPIVVARRADASTPYRIVCGERRWRACVRLADDFPVPAIIREVDEAQARAIALVENLARESLNPIEEAIGIQKMVDGGLTQAAVAETLGKTQPWVSNRLRLLGLHEDLQAIVADGIVTATFARDHILSFPWKKLPAEIRAKGQKHLATHLKKRHKQRGAVRSAEDVLGGFKGFAKWSRSFGYEWNREPKSFAGDEEDHRARCKHDIEWDWSGYPGYKSVRCFNEPLWMADHTAAVAAAQEAAAAEAGTEPGDPATTVFRADDPELEGFEEIWSCRQGHHRIDPSLIPHESLRLMRTQWMDDDEASLVTIDRDAYEAAEKAWRDRRTALVEEMVPAYIASEMRAAKDQKGNHPSHEVLAVLLLNRDLNIGTVMQEHGFLPDAEGEDLDEIMATDLEEHFGRELTHEDLMYGRPWSKWLEIRMAQLPPKSLTLVARIAAGRSQKTPFARNAAQACNSDIEAQHAKEDRAAWAAMPLHPIIAEESDESA